MKITILALQKISNRPTSLHIKAMKVGIICGEDKLESDVDSLGFYIEYVKIYLPLFSECHLENLQ